MQHRPDQFSFTYIIVHLGGFILKLKELSCNIDLLTAGYSTHSVLKYTHRPQPILVLKKTPVP